MLKSLIGSLSQYAHIGQRHGLAANHKNVKHRQSATTPILFEPCEARCFLSASMVNLSALDWASADNRVGPVERNMSNGGKLANDGGTLKLDGVAYKRGLGVYAPSQITYKLGKQYRKFTSAIGVDDSMGNRGSVVFQVFADGNKVYDSGLMTGASDTQFINLNVTGVNQLILKVRNGGDGSPSDAADWANARLTPIAATTPTPSPSDPVTYSGPIVITKGGTYSGNWQSLNPNVPAVRIATSEPVIIQNSNIRSRSDLIETSGYDANITVRNTSGYGLNPNVRGQYPGRFLNVSGFVNVNVQNNYMEGTSGIYLDSYNGNNTAKQTVRVIGNQAKNIDGRYSDGNGGFLTGPDDNYYVQFFQINGVKSLVGAEVAWNQVINEPYKSRVEDNISIHNTSGTAASPFLIHDNYIQGGYPADAAGDSSYTGGGIMLSDNGSANVRAYNNQVISTSNYGIAISSGRNNQFYNNRIVSSGYLSDGSRIASQNVGAYIWNQNGESTFSGNSGYNNVVGWAQGSGRNDAWTPDAAKWTGNTSMSGSITRATEAAEWTLWQNKLASSKVTIGPA
ncbi:MAG TPA: NPCBM/NEW2 domain-containing protein [Tepidisphaeraceae bacterium]|nr:NPCBM/NEW2 domain-containing protein [Tepidisphaeraceae bacterium]